MPFFLFRTLRQPKTTHFSGMFSALRPRWRSEQLKSGFYVTNHTRPIPFRWILRLGNGFSNLDFSAIWKFIENSTFDQKQNFFRHFAQHDTMIQLSKKKFGGVIAVGKELKFSPPSNEISSIWSHRSTIYGLIIDPYNDQLPVGLIVQLVEHCTSITEVRVRVPSRGLFLESPETFRAYFGWHNSLCIFKTKASRGTKLCSYFCFYSLCNIWKDQLYRISRSYFIEWLFGPE